MLSAGSQFSDAPAKVSKYRQVLRAIRRIRVASSAENGSSSSARGGMLSARAATGERTQAATKAAALGQAAGWKTPTATPMAAPKTTALAMRRVNPNRL